MFLSAGTLPRFCGFRQHGTMGKVRNGSGSGGFPVWPSTTTAPVFQQRFEHRVKATIAPGQILMVDAAPYNDVMLCAYLAPGSNDSYTGFSSGGNNADIILGSTTAGNYFYHSFAHYNSMLNSLVNVAAVPLNSRVAPKMRYTSFCVEIANLSQLSSLNGALRCCRIGTTTQNPAVAGTGPTYTAPWTSILNSFYENPDTQHVVGAEASHALCAHALPTQLLSGQFYTPSIEGLTSGGAAATTAWSNTVYTVSNASVGGADQDTLWTTLRFVVDNLSAQANLEFVVKATAEFIIPPESFLVGAGVPRPIGDFTGILRRASTLMKKPPVTVAPGGGGRSIGGIVGITDIDTTKKGKGKQQQQKKKQLRGSQPSTTGAPAPGTMKQLRTMFEAYQRARPAIQAARAVQQAVGALPANAQRAAIGDLRARRRR